MNKKIIFWIVVIAGMAAAAIAWYLFSSFKKDLPQATGETNGDIFSSIGESADPMGNKPDINPVDKSNPFRTIKTNPFE